MSDQTIKTSRGTSVAEAPLATIRASDVIWTHIPTGRSGTSVSGLSPAEEVFETELALAVLLAHEVVFLNAHRWRDDGPEDARATSALCVHCSDIFAWGSADAETIATVEIEELYRFWLRDREWGAAAWCVKKRCHPPQAPVAHAMQEAGWDLAALLVPACETAAE